MTVVHGYHHIDGDIPYKNMTVVPEYMEMFEKMIIDGDWAPHYSELAKLTLEAAKEHKKVVLSHATTHNEPRDHVIKKLIEGGASEDNITLIQLTIDPKGMYKMLLSFLIFVISHIYHFHFGFLNCTVQAQGWYHRSKEQLEQVGSNLTGEVDIKDFI